MKKTKTIEIPAIIHTAQFLKFVSVFAARFKSQSGYGKWLVEYEQMDRRDFFKPERLRDLYIKMLTGTFQHSYIVKDVVNNICVQALDAAKAYALNNSFEIRIITGEIATDDDEQELTGLSIEEAISICEAMNEEAEELLFRVYNSITNKLINYGSNLQK